MKVIKIASIGFIGTGLVGGTITIVGASAYDLKYAYKQKQKRPVWRPIISVIVPCSSSEGLEDCISSLTKSSVKKYEIIIVGNSLSKESQKQIQKFIKSHPKKSIRLAKTNKPGGIAAIKAGMRSVNGELVIILEPRVKTPKDTLKRTVEHFSMNETVEGFRLSVRTDEGETLSSLLQQYENSARSQALKLADITNHGTSATTNAAYRRGSLSKALRKNQLPELSYASSAVAVVQPAPSLANLFINRYWNNPGAIKIAPLMAPLVLGYFIFLAASHRNTFLLILSWLVAIGFLLMAIVGDESLAWKKKIKLTMLSPVAFILFLISSITSYTIVVKFIVGIFKKFRKN